MATIFSADERVSVVKIVSRPNAQSAAILMSDGTARHCGSARGMHYSTPFPPPLPSGVKYRDIGAQDRTSAQDGYYSALLSDGSAIYWCLDQCWSGNQKTPNHLGRPAMPIASWYEKRGVRHAMLRGIVGEGGFHKVVKDRENYIWFDSRTPIIDIRCDNAHNMVALLEDGSLHMEGSNLLKCIDESWRWSRLISVKEGDGDIVCIVGVTTSGMAMQLTDTVGDFPSKNSRDGGMVLPMPGTTVEDIECIRDSPETDRGGRTVMRGSRRAFRSHLRRKPTEAHPQGEEIMVAHLAPNTHRAATRPPNIPGAGMEDGLKTVNYNLAVAGAKDEEWVQMMVEAASNDPEIIPWLPGSLRKHPRMRGLQGLLKL
jgi:hypothetical protein